MGPGVPPYVLGARIVSIMGMSLSLSLGLLFLIGGWWLICGIAFIAFLPSLGLLVFVERYAQGAVLSTAEDKMIDLDLT
ncbi:MAG: hypothetical protein VYD09_03525 [Chloroflexota bacterium]|jgi:hypothetical protein|nr:hypothetical protein [Chloroflexota bacterium]